MRARELDGDVEDEGRILEVRLELDACEVRDAVAFGTFAAIVGARKRMPVT